MSTPAATPYRAKLFKARGEYYFTMVHCPGCSLEFRLLWPVAVLTYPEKANLLVKCPGCQLSINSDQLAPGRLCHIACCCENFPAAPVESISLGR
jgi:ribosomal protein S27E